MSIWFPFRFGSGNFFFALLIISRLRKNTTKIKKDNTRYLLYSQMIWGNSSNPIRTQGKGRGQEEERKTSSALSLTLEEERKKKSIFFLSSSSVNIYNRRILGTYWFLLPNIGFEILWAKLIKINLGRFEVLQVCVE